MSPETAIKGHYGALALYVLFASNCAAGAYYYSKTIDLEEEEPEEESEMDRCKCDRRLTIKLENVWLY